MQTFSVSRILVLNNNFDPCRSYMFMQLVLMEISMPLYSNAENVYYSAIYYEHNGSELLQLF